jgi:conjugal transfer pilus assembly protein TraB
MTSQSAPSGLSVKRRQYLLLAGLLALLLGGALLSVLLTDSAEPPVPAVPRHSTNILAPGEQVDPKDAWRGQADAELRAIQQQSRELEQKNSALENQNKAMLERLQKLEAGGLTPLPPPPVAAPAERPEFGPAPSAQAYPPPPPLPMDDTGARASSGILSVTLTPPVTSPDPSKATGHDLHRYLPSGAFTRAILLGGLDAPTGGQSQQNPQPVLLRLVDNAVLPNRFRSQIKECFVVGAGYGDVSSERAYIRTESLSCITRSGQALDVPLKGYVAGEDGKAGMRGRLVSKQGQILANALLAGIASGIGHAFQQSSTSLAVSPLGTTSVIEPGKQLQAGFAAGTGQALDRLAQYYITLAEKVFPVVEVDAGRTVDVVITQGFELQGTSLAAGDSAQFPQLAQRTQQLERDISDDE